MVNSLYFRGSSPDQTSIPNCTDGWQWHLSKSYNSLSQSPCLVAAWLEFPCYQANTTIYPLAYGQSYNGPSDTFSQPCQCNTVLYSLVSACAACQGSTWITWSQWVRNCTGPYGHSNYMFFNAIPDGTRVPYWAYLDVINTDAWNAIAAKNASDSLEFTSTGVLKIQGSSVSTTQTLSTASVVSHSPSSSSSSHRNKLHAGKIVPIVVGGIGAAMLMAVIFWYFWRRRRRAEERPTPSVDDAAQTAEAEDLRDPGPSMPLQYYDPSDPNTFPQPMLPPVPVTQTTPGGENGRGTKSTDTNDKTKYSGLPLV